MHLNVRHSLSGDISLCAQQWEEVPTSLNDENMETLVLWRYKPECSAVGRGANEEDVEDGILILRC